MSAGHSVWHFVPITDVAASPEKLPRKCGVTAPLTCPGELGTWGETPRWDRKWLGEFPDEDVGLHSKHFTTGVTTLILHGEDREGSVGFKRGFHKVALFCVVFSRTPRRRSPPNERPERRR